MGHFLFSCNILNPIPMRAGNLVIFRFILSYHFLSHFKYEFCHFRVFFFPTFASHWHLTWRCYWCLHGWRHLFWGHFLSSDIHQNGYVPLPGCFWFSAFISIAETTIHWPPFALYILTELFQTLCQLLRIMEYDCCWMLLSVTCSRPGLSPGLFSCHLHSHLYWTALNATVNLAPSLRDRLLKLFY